MPLHEPLRKNWEQKLKKKLLIVVAYSLFYDVLKYPKLMGVHFCLRMYSTGCCRVKCWSRCPWLSMLTLWHEAKPKSVHERDVKWTCAFECYVTRILSCFTCSKTSNNAFITSKRRCLNVIVRIFCWVDPPIWSSPLRLKRLGRRLKYSSKTSVILLIPWQPKGH